MALAAAQLPSSAAAEENRPPPILVQYPFIANGDLDVPNSTALVGVALSL